MKTRPIQYARHAITPARHVQGLWKQIATYARSTDRSRLALIHVPARLDTTKQLKYVIYATLHARLVLIQQLIAQVAIS